MPHADRNDDSALYFMQILNLNTVLLLFYCWHYYHQIPIHGLKVRLRTYTSHVPCI